LAAVAMLALVGCGERADPSGYSKREFVVAADRICDKHLKAILSICGRVVLPGMSG
jgi:hypothetical protein